MGIGDWGLGPIPNPQSPIPNPQSPKMILKIKSTILINYLLNIYRLIIYIIYFIFKIIIIFHLLSTTYDLNENS